MLNSDNNTINVLIACHPMNYKEDGHYDSKIINYLLTDKLGVSKQDKVIVETIDKYINKIRKPDYTADFFVNPKFEEEHTNEYHMIFVPDCAGVWVDMQMKDNKQTLESRVLATTVLEHILKMIAVGGILVFSKFIYPSFLEMFKEILEYKEYIHEELIANSDSTELITFNHENTPNSGQIYIIIYKSSKKEAGGCCRKPKRCLRRRTVRGGGARKSRRCRGRKICFNVQKRKRTHGKKSRE